MVATDSTYQTSVLSEINLELLYLSCLKCFLQKALLTIKVSEKTIDQTFGYIIKKNRSSFHIKP